MTLSELIKSATDTLACHGDIHVDFEISIGERYKSTGLETQRRNSRSEEVIAVIYGSSKDNYE